MLLACAWPYGDVTHVFAGAYGRDSYGGCSYGACAPAPPTNITAPSGLEVAINLTNGQEIPFDGYTIIVTPLNGTGMSFVEVRFYINGTLAQTVDPDETGTVRWRWDPREFPGTEVKIEITDNQGNVITRQFTIHMSGKGSQQSGAPVSSGKAQGSGPAAAIQRVYRNLQQAIGALPTPIVDSFPYILFILLGLNALLLFLQLQREIHEYRIAQAFLDRARALAEQKQMFTELTSHYLRTPLSVLAGGIELLLKDKTILSTQISLQSVADRMRAKVDQLIAQTRQSEISPVPIVGEAVSRTPFWQRSALVVPLLLIGGIVFAFDALAIQAKKFSSYEIQVIAQIIVFTLVVLTTYQLWRRITLRKRDHLKLEQIIHQEEITAAAKDQLISDTLRALRSELTGVEGILPSLDKAAGGKFIHAGSNRFKEVLANFAIADRLRGSHSTRPAVAVRLSKILQRAQDNLQERAMTRQVAVRTGEEVTFFTTEPDLLVLALHNLLDNAIAYSPAGGVVEVTAASQSDGIEIVVKDYGAGIPPQKLASLFQPFYRAQGAEDFTHEGMGFGLYLDKLIVTYLGGDIRIDSELNHGTQVFVTLPAPPRLPLGQ
jgi:signal transduction histidine kinase